MPTYVPVPGVNVGLERVGVLIVYVDDPTKLCKYPVAVAIHLIVVVTATENGEW